MQAIEMCDAQGLKGSFRQSCVFDVSATEDGKSFLAASSEAQTEAAAVQKEVEQENEAFVREYARIGEENECI